MAALTFSRLRLYNVLIGLFQLVTGVVIFAISDYGAKTKLPWYTFFIASWSRDSDQPLSDFYRPAPKQVVSFPISVWSGLFLVLSALDHLVVALPGINKVYNRYLCFNQNPFRWAEYSISASIMSVMIAQLSGVTDIHLLFTIAVLMGTTMLFGWQMEVLNGTRLPTYEYTENPKGAPVQLPPADGPLPFITSSSVNGASAPAEPHSGSWQRVDWGPFWMGCVPFLASVLVTACYFFQAVTNGDPPGFVWGIFFVLTFLYITFAINQWLQFKQVRRWTGFARAELGYMVLSLVSKQLLAWMAYGGTMRFNDEGTN